MKHDGPEVVRSFVESGLVLGLPLESGRLLDFACQPAKYTRRDFEPGHFTASAVLTQPASRRVFLIEHPKLGRWLQPGGHIEARDRSIAGAAAREADEETGFRVGAGEAVPVALSIHRIPAWGEEPSHLHLDLQFLFRITAHAEPSKAELGGSWFSLDAPESKGALEHTRELVGKILAR